MRAPAPPPTYYLYRMTCPYRAALTTLLALALPACGDDTASTSFGASTTDTTGPATTDPTTDAPTTALPTTDTPDTTSTSTSTATTTTDATTEDPTATTATTGGPGVCGVDGESVLAELVHVGEPVPCGPLEFTGQLVSDPKGPIWQLDACPCGADCLVPDPWTLTMQAPAEWLPTLPACPRIVVDRQMGFGGCQFAAVSIWDSQQPNGPAFYHAGAGFQATTAAQDELTLAPVPVQTCDCEACCGPDELWDIAFDLLAVQATVAEGQTAQLDTFTAINLESHRSGLCDAPLDVHWVVRQAG